MRKSFIGVLSVVASLAIATSALAASAFTNGSFEQGWSFGSAGYETLSPTSNADAMTSWTVTAGTVDWVSSNYATWQSQDGTYSVDMNGTSSAANTGAVGTISQTFDTTVNNQYAVDFWVSNNTACGPSTKSMSASAGGVTETVDVDSSHSVYSGSDRWVAATTLSFAATSGSATLTFAADASNTSNCGVVLDNVTITETQATGAWCKDGGWRSMVDASGTPFVNQGACVSFYATSGAVPIGHDTAVRKATMDLCKDGGWQSMTDASAASFKNQGACVSYYATGGTAPTDTVTTTQTDVTNVTGSDVTTTDVTAAQCKDGGWKSMTDAGGASFRNQGACVSYYARSGAVPNGK